MSGRTLGAMRIGFLDKMLAHGRQPAFVRIRAHDFGTNFRATLLPAFRPLPGDPPLDHAKMTPTFTMPAALWRPVIAG